MALRAARTTNPTCGLGALCAAAKNRIFQIHRTSSLLLASQAHPQCAWRVPASHTTSPSLRYFRRSSPASRPHRRALDPEPTRRHGRSFGLLALLELIRGWRAVPVPRCMTPHKCLEFLPYGLTIHHTFALDPSPLIPDLSQIVRWFDSAALTVCGSTPGATPFRSWQGRHGIHL